MSKTEFKCFQYPTISKVEDQLNAYNEKDGVDQVEVVSIIDIGSAHATNFFVTVKLWYDEQD